MKRFDYHLHSEYSMDSGESLSNISAKAIREEMEEIAVTDHAELQNPEDLPDFHCRQAELAELNQKYEGSLKLKSGIELGQPHRFPKEAEQILSETAFDFVIASLHELETLGSPANFAFDKTSAPVFFRQYFEELRVIAETADYDVLGHVTLPFRYVPESLSDLHHPMLYRREYEEIFRIVIGRGKGIEVNTSGLRTRLGEPMPGAELLSCYHNLGGRVITVGSDGHSCRSAFLGIETGMETLNRAGFETVTVFTNRIQKQVKL